MREANAVKGSLVTQIRSKHADVAQALVTGRKRRRVSAPASELELVSPNYPALP